MNSSVILFPFVSRRASSQIGRHDHINLGHL